jgi:hypothetical protein
MEATFMRSAVRAITTAAAAVILISTFAFQGIAATAMTVGDFATLLCNYGSSGSALSLAQSVDKLRRLGVPLGDTRAPLTERKLASIMDFYGIRAKTSNPNSPVNIDLANAAASTISLTSYFIGGKEKIKGGVPPGSVTVCLSETNHGQCVNCCKDQGTPAATCAQFCQDLNPPSGSEPMP